MFYIAGGIQSTQNERMKARVAELDTTHNAKLKQLDAILAAARLNYPHQTQKVEGKERHI